MASSSIASVSSQPSAITSSGIGTQTPSSQSTGLTASGFRFPTYASFPPFYTLQPNLTTRARQLDLWSQLILSYCTHHRIFRLSISNPPVDLFANQAINRSLKPGDVRIVLDHMSSPAGGSRVEWIPSSSKGELNSACYIYWRPASEWAEQVLAWVEETGQKGAVLTIYELREGEATEQKEWKGMDEGLLRKVLNVLVKRGKAQIFAGQSGGGDGEGVKFF